MRVRASLSWRTGWDRPRGGVALPAYLGLGRAPALSAVDRHITGLSFGTTHRAIVLRCRQKRHPHQALPGPVNTSRSGKPQSRTIRRRAGHKQEQRGLD